MSPLGERQADIYKDFSQASLLFPPTSMRSKGRESSVSPGQKGNQSSKKKYGVKHSDRTQVENKFYQGLRGGDVRFTVKNERNKFSQLWSTEPTNRFDRPKKMREFSILGRSGFNVQIDQPEGFSINYPVREKERKMKTLRRIAHQEVKRILNAKTVPPIVDQSISKYDPSNASVASLNIITERISLANQVLSAKID